MLSYNCTFALLKVLLSIDLLHFLVCKVPALILYQRKSRYWSVVLAFTLWLGRHFISDICPSLSPHITGLPLEDWGPIIKGEAARIQLFCPWASQKSKHKSFQCLLSAELVFSVLGSRVNSCPLGFIRPPSRDLFMPSAKFQSCLFHEGRVVLHKFSPPVNFNHLL